LREPGWETYLKTWGLASRLYKVDADLERVMRVFDPEREGGITGDYLVQFRRAYNMALFAKAKTLCFAGDDAQNMMLAAEQIFTKLVAEKVTARDLRFILASTLLPNSRQYFGALGVMLPNYVADPARLVAAAAPPPKAKGKNAGERVVATKKTGALLLIREENGAVELGHRTQEVEWVAADSDEERNRVERDEEVSSEDHRQEAEAEVAKEARQDEVRGSLADRFRFFEGNAAGARVPDHEAEPSLESESEPEAVSPQPSFEEEWEEVTLETVVDRDIASDDDLSHSDHTYDSDDDDDEFTHSDVRTSFTSADPAASSTASSTADLATLAAAAPAGFAAAARRDSDASSAAELAPDSERPSSFIAAAKRVSESPRFPRELEEEEGGGWRGPARRSASIASNATAASVVRPIMPTVEEKARRFLQ